MSSRSIFLSSLLALCIAAPLATMGCAAPTSDDVEATDDSQDELTATAKQLAGTYYTHTPAFGGFAKLKLETSGKYSALVDAKGTALCVTSPCLLPESGTWNATKTAGGYSLGLRAGVVAPRFYDAVKTSSTLKLTQNGKTETLTSLGQNACLDSSDCGSNQECGPKMCLMWCAVNDPSCCGPSTCKPKTPPPPPPPKCFGAWLDQNGLCRTPADGVYPDSCCAGMSNKCGSSSCGVGTSCCNPLYGICTKPGQACAF